MDSNMPPDVTQVKAEANFELRVTFAQVANGTVQWTEDIDISPDTLYLAGRTCNAIGR